MGIASMLAFLAVPFMRREPPSDDEQKKLRAEVESLRRQLLEMMDLADAYRRRDTQWTQNPQWAQQSLAMQGAQQSQQSLAMQGAQQSQQSLAMQGAQQSQQSLAMQGAQQSQQSLAMQGAQQSQGMQQASALQWYPCDCTPPHGRASFLTGADQ